MSWKSGSQLTQTVVSSLAVQAVICFKLARMLPWLTTTPFGIPVDPEVYCRKGWCLLVHVRAHPILSRRMCAPINDEGGELRDLRAVCSAAQNVQRISIHQRDRGSAVAHNGSQSLVRTIFPRRIGRHCNHTRVEPAQERDDEVQSGRIEQKRPVAWLRNCPQPRCSSAHSFFQLRESQSVGFALPVLKIEKGLSIRCMLRTRPKHLQKAFRNLLKNEAYCDCGGAVFI
jgi:hypothetical protein